MKRTIWISWFAIVWLVVGCAPSPFGGPRIVNHPRPELTVNLEPFRRAGCLPETYGFWSCPDSSPLAALGCDRLVEPRDLLGGLDPGYPLIECHMTPYLQGTAENLAERLAQLEQDGSFYSDGCMAPAFVRYVVFRDDEFVLLKTEEEFREVFAPVTSADEALSYSLAVTGLSAYYGLETQSGYRYHGDALEDSHVVEAKNGAYEVHLFHYQLCGCGPHTTSATDVLVSADGDVTLGQYTPIFDDKSEDSLCVD